MAKPKKKVAKMYEVTFEPKSNINCSVVAVAAQDSYILTFTLKDGKLFHKILEWISLSNSSLIFSDHKTFMIKCKISKDAIPVFKQITGVPLGLR